MVRNRSSGNRLSRIKESNTMDPAKMQDEFLQAADLQAAGKFNAAIRKYDRLLAAHSGLAEVHNNKAMALIALGKIRDGISALRTAIRLRCDYVEAQTNLGVALTESGQLDEAINLLQQMIIRYPQDFEAHGNLGNAYFLNSNFDAAILQCEKAIELNKNFIPAYDWLANIWMMKGKPDVAITYYKKIIELDKKAESAHTNIANILEKTHQLDDALEWIESIWSQGGREPNTVYVYALILRRLNRFDEALNVLQELIQQRLPEAIAARAHFEIGEILDRQEECTQAFRHFIRANEFQIRNEHSMQQQKKKYFSEVTRIHKAINGDYPQLVRNTDQTTHPTIIFLMGFPRSGTTLLDQALDSHPDIQVMEEQPALEVVLNQLEKNGVYPTRLEHLNTEELDKLREQYFEVVDKHIDRKDTGVLVDKFPLNIRYVGLIEKLFPDARLLIALRHPCDVVLSCFKQYFKLNPAMANFTSLKDTADLYAEVMGLWCEYEKRTQLSVLKVRYEDLVIDFESELKKIIEFTDENWDEKILNYSSHAKSRKLINTPSYAQVTEPIYNRARYRWKRYEIELKPVISTLRAFITGFGYDE